MHGHYRHQLEGQRIAMAVVPSAEFFTTHCWQMATLLTKTAFSEIVVVMRTTTSFARRENKFLEARLGSPNRAVKGS
jgi:hypothetical protein